jgi:4a-hydroxytetrahydrobiopterin dehydratase
MARFCDEKAGELGEVVVEAKAAGGEEGGVGRELVERVGVEAGDCCVPKNAKKQA